MKEYTQEEIEIMEAEHQLEMERWWWMNQES